MSKSLIFPELHCSILQDFAVLETCITLLTIQLLGHSCKIGNMRCPGTLKNQNPQFEEKK